MRIHVSLGLITREYVMSDDLYTYTGSTPVSKGDTVVWMDEDDLPYKAEVMECMASQFLVAISTGKVTHHRYCFYSDKGYRWNHQEENKSQSQFQLKPAVTCRAPPPVYDNGGDG